MGEVVVALLAFVGAVLGSVLTFVATQRAGRRDERSRRQEEWGRRFTTALQAFTAADASTRAVGRALLVELSDSELASAEDRQTASTALQAGATTGGRHDLTGLLGPAGVADLVSREQVADARAAIEVAGGVENVDPLIAEIAAVRPRDARGGPSVGDR